MNLAPCVRIAFAALTAALLITGCGGGGSSGDPSAPAAAVARVQIDDSGLLLGAPLQTRQLTARAFDSQGHEVPAAAIAWRSTRASVLSVDAKGLVRAEAANGSAQIVASVGGVSSPPLLGVVAQTAPGVVVLSDAQIGGDPTDSNPDAPPSFSNTYRVPLAVGTVAPAVGTLVLGSGSKPVAGRVVAVDTGSTLPVLVVTPVALRELVPGVTIDEVIDMSQAEVVIDPRIASTYDVVRNGSTFTFSPKAGVRSNTERQRAQAAVGTRALGPFGECEVTATGFNEDSPLPIALRAPPLFSVAMTPSLEFQHTSSGLQKLVVTGQPTFKFEGGVTVAAAFSGKVACEAELLKFRIPVGGFLSFIAAGQVALGVSMEAGGEVTLATMGLTTKVEATTTARAGIECAGGACGFVSSLEGFTASFVPQIDLPSVSDFCVEPSLAAAGTVKLKFGNPFFKALQFEFVKAKAGAKLSGRFSPIASQFLSEEEHNAGKQACNADGYALSLDGSAGVGSDIEGFLKYFGLDSVSLFEVTVSSRIGGSPRIAQAFSDRIAPVAGQASHFAIRLEPSSVNLIDGVGPYNVNRVLLVRESGGLATVVAEQIATEGQTDFTLTITEPQAGQQDDYIAFVVPNLAPIEAMATNGGGILANASRWAGEVTFNQSSGDTILLATLVFFPDGSISGIVRGLNVTGQVDNGGSISFGIAIGGDLKASFSGAIDAAQMDMHGGWSGINFQTGGTDAGTWHLQRCLGPGLPIEACQ